MRNASSLLVMAFFLAACGSHSGSDRLASYEGTFQKMEGAIDNDFSDVATRNKDGPETLTSVGFYSQYPCTVENDGGNHYGYCLLGVGSSRSTVDDDYEFGKQVIAKGDPTLKPVSTPAGVTGFADDALFESDTRAVFLFEKLQSNGEYVVKMTFAKPSALK